MFFFFFFVCLHQIGEIVYKSVVNFMEKTQTFTNQPMVCIWKFMVANLLRAAHIQMAIYSFVFLLFEFWI